MPDGATVLGSVDPERVRAVEPARATAACALRRRASLPVSVAGLPLVPALINNSPATLVLDTGAENTLLTAVAAKRLHVTTQYDFVRSMTGIGGSLKTGDAALRSMSIGGLALAYPRALVGAVDLQIGTLDADGWLGASMLGEFDLDIDLPHRRIDLYAPTECGTARPAWGGRYLTIETTRSLSLHPFFPITVNGHTLSATLDTGAQRSVISARAAQAAGIGAGSQLAGPPMLARGAAGETLPATLHAVDLRVAGLRLRSPVVVTAAQLPRDIDALVGLDFLLSHRAWLSYGSRRLFLAAE